MMDITSNLRFRIHTTHNESFVAYLDSSREEDDIGALYYVVAVVLIYALSIVMMIASHIRKDQQDTQLRTYLKEMAVLRKNDRRDKIIGKLSKPTIALSKPSKADLPVTTDFKTKPTLVVYKSYGVDMPVANDVQVVAVKDVDGQYKETLFGKTNSSDDTNDSGFQAATDYCTNLIKDDNQSPKPEHRSCAEIHVINENIAL